MIEIIKDQQIGCMHKECLAAHRVSNFVIQCSDIGKYKIAPMSAMRRTSNYSEYLTSFPHLVPVSPWYCCTCNDLRNACCTRTQPLYPQRVLQHDVASA